MVLNCERCKVQFTNEYLLQKHLNRKIPCDIIFKCIICKKILASKKSLERHEKKQKPCIEVKEIKPNEKKEIKISEKQRQKELELEIQKEKSRRKEGERKFKLELLEKKETEKRKQIELKLQLQQEKIIALKELKELEYAMLDKKARDNKEYINMYAENNKSKKASALEIIKAKAESMKNIEVMKNERKEQTPQIINNNVTINNINICINHIKENHLDKLDIDFNQMQPTAIEYFKKNILHSNENISARTLIHIFNKYDTCNGIMDHILRMAYNNLERNNKRCVWYMKDHEYYFAGSLKGDEKTVRKIDFGKDLFPLLKNTLTSTLIPMTEFVKKYVKMGCAYEPGGVSTIYMKHQNLLYYQRNVLPFTECLSDIKKMSDKVFEIESPEFS
jgi:hypothetical protein